jgi:hypothetical protein
MFFFREKITFAKNKFFFYQLLKLFPITIFIESSHAATPYIFFRSHGTETLGIFIIIIIKNGNIRIQKQYIMTLTFIKKNLIRDLCVWVLWVKMSVKKN